GIFSAPPSLSAVIFVRRCAGYGWAGRIGCRRDNRRKNRALAKRGHSPLTPMPMVKPFAALRPRPELAARICELPYDVMSSEEARRVGTNNPFSFFHVSKPEIDLPQETNSYSANVYEKGRENFRKLIAQGALRQDPEPCFYLYRQVMGGHSQTGVVGVASCEDYLGGSIKKHELTRPDKEDDRVRHIEALNAQTGPVFLVHPASDVIDRLVSDKTTEPADVDFIANDSVRHMSWTISDRS